MHSAASASNGGSMTVPAHAHAHSHSLPIRDEQHRPSPQQAHAHTLSQPPAPIRAYSHASSAGSERTAVGGRSSSGSGASRLSPSASFSSASSSSSSSSSHRSASSHRSSSKHADADADADVEAATASESEKLLAQHKAGRGLFGLAALLGGRARSGSGGSGSTGLATGSGSEETLLGGSGSYTGAYADSSCEKGGMAGASLLSGRPGRRRRGSPSLSLRRSVRVALHRACSRQALVLALCAATALWAMQLASIADAWSEEGARQAMRAAEAQAQGQAQTQTQVQAAATGPGALPAAASAAASAASASASTSFALSSGLPLLLRLWAYVSLLCALAGAYGAVRCRPRALVAFVAQQAADAFLCVFQALAATLLLYHPAVQHYVCERLAVHAMPQAPAEHASGAGGSFTATAAASAAQSGASLLRRRSAMSSAATSAGAAALQRLEARLGRSGTAVCAKTLTNRFIPTALALLAVYTALRLYLFVQTYRFYRALAFDAALASGELELAFDERAGAYVLLDGPAHEHAHAHAHADVHGHGHGHVHARDYAFAPASAPESDDELEGQGAVLARLDAQAQAVELGRHPAGAGHAAAPVLGEQPREGRLGARPLAAIAMHGSHVPRPPSSLAPTEDEEGRKVRGTPSKRFR